MNRLDDLRTSIEVLAKLAARYREEETDGSAQVRLRQAEATLNDAARVLNPDITAVDGLDVITRHGDRHFIRGDRVVIVPEHERFPGRGGVVDSHSTGGWYVLLDALPGDRLERRIFLRPEDVRAEDPR